MNQLARAVKIIWVNILKELSVNIKNFLQRALWFICTGVIVTFTGMFEVLPMKDRLCTLGSLVTVNGILQ